MSDWHDTREYRVWRAQVIMRDKRCRVCGSMEKRAAHHINHGTYFPEQRYDVNNGVTLCGKCHMNYHCNYHRSYRTKCDLYSFNNFMYLAGHFAEVFIVDFTDKPEVIGAVKKTEVQLALGVYDN